MANDTSPIIDFSKKVIWVIGGAGYLGQATTLMLKSAGAKALCIELFEAGALTVPCNWDGRIETFTYKSCMIFSNCFRGMDRTTALPIFSNNT